MRFSAHIASNEGSFMKKESKTPTVWISMTVAAMLTSAYALNFVFGTPPGDPRVQKRMVGSASGLFHVICGLVALILGPIQFRNVWRKKYPKLHIWLGRVYIFCIVFSGISAFKITFGSLAHPIGNVGFALLATAWLYTASMGLIEILRGNVLLHEKWMTRNFALTYAAPVLRLYLPLMIVMGMDGSLALSINGYISWIPNLIYAERYIVRNRIKSAVE